MLDTGLDRCLLTGSARTALLLIAVTVVLIAGVAVALTLVRRLLRRLTVVGSGKAGNGSGRCLRVVSYRSRTALLRRLAVPTLVGTARLVVLRWRLTVATLVRLLTVA